MCHKQNISKLERLYTKLSGKDHEPCSGTSGDRIYKLESLVEKIQKEIDELLAKKDNNEKGRRNISG